MNIRTSDMRIPFVPLAAAALLMIAVGFVAASARSAERSGLVGQRSAASAAQKSAAPSMVVYKSPT